MPAFECDQLVSVFHSVCFLDLKLCRRTHVRESLGERVLKPRQDTVRA